MQVFNDIFGWIQLALYTGLLLLLTRPTGAYLFQALDGNGKTFLDPILRPLERTLSFLMRIDSQKEQDWKQYTVTMLAFSLVGVLFTYAILRLQHLLPLNPQGLGPFTDHLAFNGMRIAIQANVRAASAARRGFNEALSIAYYAGTITGMLTDGLGLLGGTIIFMVFGRAAPDALLGFGFGGTLLALFMRVGGGIYTKAADVGADLVGKVEQDIPEDDPRNAAVIADLVGDNVGDCAGMAADIFESYEVTIVSGLILGLALVAVTGDLKWIIYPLIIRAIGVISSILGTFTVPIWEKFPIKFLRAHDAEEAMFRSYEVSSVNTIFWAILLSIWYAHDWRLSTDGHFNSLSNRQEIGMRF